MKKLFKSALLIMSAMVVLSSCNPTVEPKKPTKPDTVVKDVIMTFNSVQWRGAISETIHMFTASMLENTLKVDERGGVEGNGLSVFLFIGTPNVSNSSYKLPAGTYEFATEPAANKLLAGKLQGESVMGSFVRKVTNGESGDPIVLTEGKLVLTETAGKYKAELTTKIDGKDKKFVAEGTFTVENMSKYAYEAFEKTTDNLIMTKFTKGIYKVAAGTTPAYQIMNFTVADDLTSKKVSMLMFLKEGADATKPVVGTYTFSERIEKEKLYAGFFQNRNIGGTFVYTNVEEGGKTYINDIWYLVSGAGLTITQNGENYTLDLTATSGMGSTFTITYTGAITLTTPPAPTFAMTSDMTPIKRSFR